MPINEPLPQSQTQLVTTLLGNLRELHKGFQAVHNSTFTFSWIRLWPFSLFLPQPDYLRGAGLLEKIIPQLGEQAQFCKTHSKPSPQSPHLHEFYEFALAYIECLQASCQHLVTICQYKHSVLLKTPTLTIKEFNTALKEYQAVTQKQVQAGALLQQKLHAIKLGS
jgi:hypothetical protein